MPKNEQRMVENDIRKNESYRREDEIREIHKSLVAKQKEIEDYVNIQLKRPVSSTPKT